MHFWTDLYLLSLFIQLQVTELGLRERVLQQAARKNDKWGKEVTARIVAIPDLVAADAEYHRKCHRKFMLKVRQRVKEKRGAPENLEINNAMDQIFSYLESHDECQYSIDDLLRMGGK